MNTASAAAWTSRGRSRSGNSWSLLGKRRRPGCASVVEEGQVPGDVTEVFEGGSSSDDSLSPSHSAVWRAWYATRGDRRVRERTLELLLHVVPLTHFLDASPAVPQYGRAAGNTWIDGLVALAHHWQGWQRPVEDWRPHTHNTRRQFASLARHLLTQYPVPSFMDSVWFLGTGPSALRFQRWFGHIGTGNSIRMADVPIPLTKRMAHHFMPDCYTYVHFFLFGG